MSFFSVVTYLLVFNINFLVFCHDGRAYVESQTIFRDLFLLVVHHDRPFCYPKCFLLLASS